MNGQVDTIFNVKKTGWHSISEQVSLNNDGTSGGGIVVTLHISPDSAMTADASPAGDKTTSAPSASVASETTADEVPQTTATEASSTNSHAFRPAPILMISAPVGSTAHIEFSDTLASDDWKPLTTITISVSPFAFVCGLEEGPLPSRRFYRAVITSPE